MDIEKAVLICKALSDLNRMRIVPRLTQGECCACELLEKLMITQPTLSHHMKQLEYAGIIRCRKDWKWMYYSPDCETLTANREFIASLRCTGGVS